ncbi:MAG: hypothetical protein RIT30_767, partial [Bacteroidota bacterium]
QRDDLEYLFTLTFELDRNHVALSTKDRTGLFSNKQGQLIGKNAHIDHAISLSFEHF